jgi:PEGA domain
MRRLLSDLFLLFGLVTLLSAVLVAENTGQFVKVPAEKARVFITDSQSWETSGGGGGSSSGFGGGGSGGARPQTAEIIKTFAERCPDVMANNIQSKADYVVVLDHEGGKSFLRHRNKVAVFARVSGDSVMSKSTLSLGASVQEACLAIRKDWAQNSATIRAAGDSGGAGQGKPAQVEHVAEANSTKISVVSTPAGADIEIDGGFVGNTPSTIHVPAGEHTVSVTKKGFNAWERKIKASGGDVSLNVELEAAQK